MPKSKNYYWNSESLLGSGAVGEVYKGYHLDTGESVAIKVMKKFNPKQMSHLLSLQDRELEVLQKLDHPNIVKLIDVELEPGNSGGSNHGKKIIVMELCTGGSLYNLLASPENVFGLDDKEFLNVLKGIASGMEKLHKEHIVHRDIKPGNIMRFIGEDGRAIYKLIDFGAARELHSEQEFESIYGTEEYLHPGIYEKAFIDNGLEQSFKHSVDLWSIGATLYHVAAGQIPFQSFNGRKDRKTMYDIIANKKSGDISGIQEIKNGKIIYSQHLPEVCIMSLGLRPLVEDLLARLLETDETKALSFEQFFSISKNIINKKVVSVFDCNSTKVLKIYMDPGCVFHEFQELLKSQTGVDSDQQMLLYENLDFVEQFGGDAKVMTCGEVVDSDPVYLFSKPSPAKNLDDVKYNIPTKPAIYNVPNCLNFSRYCCESLNFIKRNIDMCLLRQKLIYSGAIMLIRFLGRKYDKFSMQLQHLEDMSQVIRLGLEKFEILTSNLLFSDQKLGEKARNSLVRQRDLFSEVVGEIKSIVSKSTELESKLQLAVSLWVGEKPSCKEDDCCLSRIEVAVTQVMDIHQEFGTTKQDDITRVKCQKLEKYCTSAKSLIEGHCQVNAKQLVEIFRNFMRSIWPEKKALEDSNEALEGQFQRQKLLLESMEESFKRLKQSMPEPGPEVKGLAKDESRRLSVEEGRLILRRRESVEKKYAAQLYSITYNANNAKLSSQLIPLAEENNKILEGILNLVERNLSISSSTDGKEMETFHGNPSSQADRTLT